jgi:hypothetical protein
MNRTPVSSSNLASVGFDTLSGTLEVEFHSGTVYRYFQVPRYMFDGLMAASSKGSYFAENIRDGFQFQRVI